MSLKEINDEEAEQPAVPVEIKVPIPRYTVIILLCLAAVFAVQMGGCCAARTLSDLFFHPLRGSALAAGFVKPLFVHGEYGGYSQARFCTLPRPLADEQLRVLQLRQAF